MKEYRRILKSLGRTTRQGAPPSPGSTRRKQRNHPLVQVALRLLGGRLERVVAPVLPLGQRHKVGQVLLVGGQARRDGGLNGRQELRVVKSVTGFLKAGSRWGTWEGARALQQCAWA